MSGCLSGKSKGYGDFDAENMQPQDVKHVIDGHGSSGNGPSGSSGSSRRRFSWPMLLSLAALLLGITALALAAYAADAARRLSAGGSGQAGGLSLTASPRDTPAGQQAVSIFRGTGYFGQQLGMLHPRSDHRALPLGNTVYLLGGLTNAAKADGAAPARALKPVVLNAVTAYDTYSQRSAAVAPMPAPRFRFCAAVLDGRLYVVGGMAAFEPAEATKHVVSNQVMRYTPETDSWEVLPGRLNHARSDCCAAAAAGKLVVAGGWWTDYSDTLGSAEVFDPARGTWSLLPNMTQPRGDCEAVGLQGRVIVLGGVDPAGNFTASVEALDVSSDRPAWSARAPMLTPRGDFAAEALPGGRVIVMGGETSNGTATEFALHDVEEYSDRADSWVPKAPLPEARFRFDSAHVKNNVWVFGGHPTCSSKQGTDKSPCVAVALSSVWAFFDVQTPDVFVNVARD